MESMTTLTMLPPDTRVWIYQSNRPFSSEDLPKIRETVQYFAQLWVSHNQQLRAWSDVLHRRFIVLMVDESQAGASGCSIDKSVHFLKALQAEYQVDLFDRLVFSYLDGETVHTVPRETFAQLYADGVIHDETPVFDTLVSTKGAFDQGFVRPLGQSWHKRMV